MLHLFNMGLHTENHLPSPSERNVICGRTVTRISLFLQVALYCYIVHDRAVECGVEHIQPL